MYTFIGGASTVTGKHDRRVNHRREKSFMMKLGRPRQMLLLPESKTGTGRVTTQGTPDHSVHHSRSDYILFIF